MSSVAYVLVILLSLGIRVLSKAICEEDGMSIADMKNAGREERIEQVRKELSSDDGESDEYATPGGPTTKSSNEGRELSSKMSAEDGPSALKKAMEGEGTDPDIKEVPSKSKREICNRILQQLRDLPCDNPVIITCGGEDTVYRCTGNALSDGPLREALSNANNILSAADAAPQPLVPSQVSPVQSIPIAPLPAAANLLPGVRPQDFKPYFPQTRILTAEERREKQKGIFEGLLRFGTVVNQVDSFLTDKSKMIIRGLHRMVQSEEDSRFN